MTRSVTIITNIASADYFIKNKPPGSGKVVCFTPAIKIILQKAGIEANFLVEEYSNLAHARTAINQYRSYISLTEQLAVMYNDETISQCVGAKYWWLAATYFRIHYSLKNYDSFSFHDGTKWQSTTSHNKTVKAIFDILQVRKTKKALSGRGFAALPLYKLHNYLLMRKLRKNKFVVITHDKRKLPKIASQLGVKVVSLDFTRIRFLKIVKAIMSLLKDKKNFNYYLYPSIFSQVKNYPIHFNNKLHQDAFSACHDLLDIDLADVISYRPSYLNLTNNPQLALVISDYISDSKILPFCKAANSRNVPVFLINHGSHVPHKSRISSLVDSTYAQFGRVTSPYAKYLILRNPLVFTLAEELQDKNKKIKANLSKVIKKEAKNEKFTILHAGNFSSWDDHVPWITETAEEFLLGIKDFADAVKPLKNCQLIIRVKGKKSYCNAEVIKNFIGTADNIEIKDDANFYADLAIADVLVASNSNTIHEALENQVPVLLYSYRNRYHHCEPDNRTVYAVKNKTELPSILNKIMTEKINKNLSTKQFQAYSWDETVADEKLLCEFISKKI